MSGNSTPAGTAEALRHGQAAADWEAVRAASDIQYAPLPIPAAPPTPPLPDWLAALGRLLRALFEPLGRAIGVGWPIMEKLLIALAILAALALVWRLGRTVLALRRPAAARPDSGWTPDHDVALALLDEADRLAGEGRYDAATHLLLRRSIADIADSQPGLLHPASTAREIAALPALPPRARRAFAIIADRVERSLFALRPLSGEDWAAARRAYAEFALAGASDPAR